MQKLIQSYQTEGDLWNENTRMLVTTKKNKAMKLYH